MRHWPECIADGIGKPKVLNCKIIFLKHEFKKFCSFFVFQFFHNFHIFINFPWLSWKILFSLIFYDHGNPDRMGIVWNICRLLEKCRSFQHHDLSHNFLTYNFSCSWEKHVFIKSFYFSRKQNHILVFKIRRVITNF